MGRVVVAKILLINERHQGLMLRRSEYKLHPEKSHQPDLPGGLVDPGESEHQAVIRELREEAGIVIDPNRVMLGYSETKFYETNGESVVKLLYFATLEETPQVTLSWEHETYEWHDVRTFTSTYEFTQFYKDGINYLVERGLV